MTAPELEGTVTAPAPLSFYPQGRALVGVLAGRRPPCQVPKLHPDDLLDRGARSAQNHEQKPRDADHCSSHKPPSEFPWALSFEARFLGFLVTPPLSLLLGMC